MDESITVKEVRENLELVSLAMRKIVIHGTFEKFTDEEKDSFNRMKIILDNTRYSTWKI